MRVLLVHPSPLMYSELYLRLEPLGLERVAAAIRAAGHEVRLLDLQIFSHTDYWRELETFAPQAVGFSVNYLANVPEVVDLAKETKAKRREAFVFFGRAQRVVRGRRVPRARGGRDRLHRAWRGRGHRPARAGGHRRSETRHPARRGDPDRRGPEPTLLDNLDLHLPARDLGRKRHKYFIGVLDPCASVEFTRGCPWDCSFCSAWTFYGRSYRKGTPEAAGEDLARIREPNVFIVDDVASSTPNTATPIANEIERRRIRKQYYLRDPLRRADQEPGAVRPLEASRPSSTCSSASRPSTRTPSRRIASGSPSTRTCARSRSPARSGSRWRSTSSRTRAGTRRASRRCATGR